MPEGYLITNAFIAGEGFRRAAERFMAAAARADVRLLPRTNADFLMLPDNLPDFALFYDKDIRLASRLEAKGLRLYNSARAIALCDDKTLTFLALEGSGVPMPQTLLCPQSFPGLGYGDARFVEQAGDLLGWPMIIKEGYGSFGRQVYLARDPSQARAFIARAGAVPILFQRFIQESAGRDLRLFVVGGQVVASMMRRSGSDNFRANIEGGGHAERHEATSEETKVALDACEKLKLDFAGVDLLISKDGPLLCEVNSNAHFDALSAISNVDPADYILRYIKGEMGVCADA